MNDSNPMIAAVELEDSLAEVKNVVKKIYNIPMCNDESTSIDMPRLFHCSKRLSDIEAAKLNVTLAYALATLFYSGSISSPSSTVDSSHQIKQDLARIRQFVTGLKDIDSQLETNKIMSKVEPATVDTEKCSSNGNSSCGSNKRKSVEILDDDNNDSDSNSDIEPDSTNNSSKKKNKKKRKSKINKVAAKRLIKHHINA